MNYKLPVYTAEELEAANSYPPLENGRYKFRVLERKQALSVNNNPQEQLVLEVHYKPNQTKKCWRNFTFKEITPTSSKEDIKTSKWLIKIIKEFLVCVGVEYTPDAFDRVVNTEGVADFYVKEYTSKKGKQQEKFVVPNEGGFLSPSELNKPATSTTQIGAGATPKPTVTESKAFDDDIPF
jgi:hypothetical protein